MRSLPYRSLTACVIAAASSHAASAQTKSATPPATEAPADKRPLGWLSDPNTPAPNFAEALFSGKLHLDDNIRWEFADTTGRRHSNAVTNRLRLGYESKPFIGLSAFVEIESVYTPNEENYWVPQTLDGDPRRTVIADPPGTEINQAYGRFSTKALFDADVHLDLRGGRQRIKLDDDRFIGNVGWRQFEQTYDAISARTNFGVEKLSVFYAYVWDVQRIFGPDGPNPDSDSHLLNISYGFDPALRATGFLYVIDFEDDDPLNSSQSAGLRLTGELFKTAADPKDFWLDYELTYAHQSDTGDNPVDYDADFFAAQVRLHRKGLGYFMLGYQLLGSDGGTFAFRFPLGTNHAFQGFADNFLVTPAFGVQDAYVGIGADLAWGVKGTLTYHEYWSDEGSDDLGEELDFTLSKKISPNWSVLVKGAFYDGDSGQPDTTRFWVQTTFTF